MTVIDKHGERKACDRCHKVRVLDIRRGVCAGCREQIAQAKRNVVEFVSWAKMRVTARARKYAECPYADAV